MSIAAIKWYLDTTAKFGSKLSPFILKHGREYRITSDTFSGKRATAKQCYRNAGSLALFNDAFTYVEGYVTVHGVPIHHAWVVDADGNVIDPTLRHGKDGRVGAYFGVPFKTEFLRKSILHTKMWGLLGGATMDLTRAIVESDGANAVAA